MTDTGKRVSYKLATTSVVSSISPMNGPSSGGTELTITGKGLSDQMTLTLGGVTCASITEVTAGTKYTCTTGAITTTGNNAVEATVPNMGVYVAPGAKFNYFHDWTEPRTWGGDEIPQDGDSVHIPKGVHVRMNANKVGVLGAVLIEGALYFKPETDATHHREFAAEYIFVKDGGHLEIGTEANPYTSKLTITMHGTK